MAGRMACWLLVLPLLKRIMPLPALVSMMRGRRPGPPGPAATWPRLSLSEIERMSRITRWLARRVSPWRSGTCLEQSLVLYRFLSARSAPAELIIGVRRADERVGAHAWVTVDGRPVGESLSSVSEFAPVVTFAAQRAS
jgi:hypothetical protein